jgi:hypothetical protein
MCQIILSPKPLRITVRSLVVLLHWCIKLTLQVHHFRATFCFIWQRYEDYVPGARLRDNTFLARLAEQTGFAGDRAPNKRSLLAGQDCISLSICGGVNPKVRILREARPRLAVFGPLSVNLTGLHPTCQAVACDERAPPLMMRRSSANASLLPGTCKLMTRTRCKAQS